MTIPHQELISPARTLFVSTFPPEECGIAAFTRDLADSMDLAAGLRVTSLAVIHRSRPSILNDLRVRHVIHNHDVGAYRQAALEANADSCDVVSLQHEFGLYPGEWGAGVLEFVRACRKPIITTFHTLMSTPPAGARGVIRSLALFSSGIVVMTQAASRLLSEICGGALDRVRIIPHGVPRMPRHSGAESKAKLGLADRRVLCTFGLISRGKGLEHMIEAMPRIAAEYPDVLYLIVGVTHPLVKDQEGEAYRIFLAEKAELLGVGKYVRFINEFLSLPDLLTLLSACDVYVTPYPGKDQIASGTLAYAMAAGLPVVSTPYLYAEEMLADGRGQLVPFGQSDALAKATLRYLGDDAFRIRTRNRAYLHAVPMRWLNVAREYQQFADDLTGSVLKRRKPLPAGDEPLLGAV